MADENQNHPDQDHQTSAGTHSRADFLRLSGAALAGVTAGPFLGAVGAMADGRPPDLIVRTGPGGVVYPVDPHRPTAEAFAVRDGRFVAVGSVRDIAKLAGPDTDVLDVGSSCVTPGFIDTHNHGAGVNENFGVLVGNPLDVEIVTIDSIVDKLSERAQELPADFRVIGLFFDDTKLEEFLAEGRGLHMTDLDRVSTEHPVRVNHRGGHTSWYNSYTFEQAGITDDTPDPPDGHFFRDADGRLTGQAAESARDPLNAVGQAEEFTPEEQRERARIGIEYMTDSYASLGLTQVGHMSVSAGTYEAILAVREAGNLRHRVNVICSASLRNTLQSQGIITGHGDEWVRIGGVKFFADGSFSERTMAMSVPYPGTDPPFFGVVTITQEALNETVANAHDSGWQVAVHANGDVTIDMVLQAFERAQELNPRVDTRHRLEHCTMVNDDLLERIKAGGYIPCPFWTYAYYSSEKWHFYGARLMRQMMAHKWFLNRGIPVAGASDYGPGPYPPLLAIQSMVTRRGWDGQAWGPNQMIDVDQALRVATINGAHASHEEDIKGSITPGKLADFVVLEKDPHRVPRDQIKDITIQRTVVGGRTVYAA